MFDSFKLMPANPSFLAARDSILRALDDLKAKGTVDDLQYQASRKACWTVFAKFGMGPNAKTNGAFLNGITADFNLPDGLVAAPAAPATAATADDGAANLVRIIQSLTPQKRKALEELLRT